MEIYEFIFFLCKLLVYNVLFNIKHSPFLKVKWSLDSTEIVFCPSLERALYFLMDDKFCVVQLLRVKKIIIMEKYCFWILFYIILSFLINKLSTALNKTGTTCLKCLFDLIHFPITTGLNQINMKHLSNIHHNIADILLKSALNTNQSINQGLLWSYGSWIYNYICNQYLTPLMALMLRVRTPLKRGVLIQHYVIKFVSDLLQGGGFPWVLRFPPPIKLSATI